MVVGVGVVFCEYLLDVFVGSTCFFGKNGWNLMEPVVFFVGRSRMIVNGLPK